MLNWDWDRLNRIGQSKALKSSYWFMLLVPTLAKMLKHLPTETVIFGKQYSFYTDLPFSWVALFFCAVLVSIGNVIYALFCPRLIKGFEDYQSFERSGRGSEFLRQALNVARPEDVDQVVERIVVKSLASRDAASVLNAKHQLKQYGGAGPESFYLVRDALNLVHPRFRAIASTCYLFGFLLLVWVATQNVWSVLSYLLRGVFG